jgi:cysteine-rich repeat protein
VNGDGCNATCWFETCGDGYLDTNGPDNIPGNADDEQCDDGNNVNGDGCNSLCAIEVPNPYCGDGNIDA